MFRNLFVRFKFNKLNSIIRIIFVHFFSGIVPLYIVNEYPKSGGTWLGNMLSEALGVYFPRNEIPKLESCIMHGHYINPINMKNVVVMWRDGRDILISQYYHYLFKNELYNGDLVNKTRNKLKFKDYYDIESNLPIFIQFLFEKKLHPKFTWDDFVKVWYEKDNSISTYYEKIRNNTAFELKILVKKLTKKELSDDTANKIVKKYSFENISGRNTGKENNRSFMRKGIVGDWKNHFSKAAKEAFDYYAGESLIKLGYEKDHSWVNE